MVKTCGVPAPSREDALVTAASERAGEIVTALSQLSPAELAAPSRLGGWSRLTITCHLRYGAEALAAMTRDARAGRPASYYPEGRVRQRPATLVPRHGERPEQVVATLGSASRLLHQDWSKMRAWEWNGAIAEPPGNVDLGPLPLGSLPLLRLTEVEVHGTDLGLGLDEWSETFIAAALPFRLDWLNVRRANHRPVDEAVEGEWLLAPEGGPTYLVSVHGSRVEARPRDEGTGARSRIRGTRRDILSLLLGRPTEGLAFEGDVELAQSFGRVFPGP